MTFDFLTVPQASKQLDCSERRIYDAIRAGDLRAARPGKKFLIRPESLDAWLTSLEDAKQGSAA